jgi:ubiquinone biosynthesis monooxygenase Coq6
LTYLGSASSSSITSSNKLTLLESSSISTTISNWTPASTSHYSNRVSSITNNNAQFLHKIGVWQHLEKSRINSIEEIQVWDGISDARLVFDDQDVNSDKTITSYPGTTANQDTLAMATLLENLNLQRASYQAIQQHRQSNSQLDLQILDGRKVISINKDQASGWPIVELGPSQRGDPAISLRARLLVSTSHGSYIRPHQAHLT